MSERHEFYQGIIDQRKEKTKDMFDASILGMLIPCYNEKEEIKMTLRSLNNEIPHLEIEPYEKISYARTYNIPPDKLLRGLFLYIVVDGSGVAQLETAIAAVRAIRSEMLTDKSGSKLKVRSPPEDLTLRDTLESAGGELEDMLKWTTNIKSHEDDLDKKVALFTENERADTAKKIKMDRDRLLNVFSEHLKKQENDAAQGDYRFDNYRTSLLKYAFVLESQKRNFFLRITLLVKKENQQKRDSLLLASYCCLNEKSIPLYLQLVDCDTEWDAGSVSSMYRHMIKNPRCVGVSGTILLRNARWANFLLQYQDFCYILSQIGTKEAEHVVGMVTCLPGAFSMLKIWNATLPNILEEFTRHGSGFVDKNKLDLGEDRFWTTLILENALAGEKDERTDEIVRGTVKYKKTAVARTDAPETVNNYIMQQRRWINSTILNFIAGLIPSLNQKCCSTNCAQIIGSLYLWFRFVLEFVGFVMSPSFTAFFAYSMMQDFDFPKVWSLVATMSMLFLCLLLVLLYEKPQGAYSYFYSSYIIVASITFGALIVAWTAKTFVIVFGDYASGYDHVDYNLLRNIAVVVTFLFIILLSLLHGYLWRMIFPPWKPFIYLGFLPLQYVLLPIFSVLNLADFSWGNRDSVAAASKKELEEARFQVKNIFLLFTLFNSAFFVTCYQLSKSTQNIIFSCMCLFVLASMIWTFILSFCSACVHAFHKIVRAKERRARKKKRQSSKFISVGDDETGAHSQVSEQLLGENVRDDTYYKFQDGSRA